jgi:hypothetical protein
MMMSDVLPDVVEVLLNVFCELVVQNLCKERTRMSRIVECKFSAEEANTRVLYKRGC